MYGKLKNQLLEELKSIKESGLYKNERTIVTPQGVDIRVSSGDEVINFCANNYLGLSSHPRVIQAAKDSLDTHGFGLSSVRFICGTQDIHKTLEHKLAEFLGTAFFVYIILSTGNPLAIGAALALAILITSPISGGHINPAVSIVMASAGKMQVNDLIPYCLAQIFGGLVALELFKRYKL